LVAPSLAGEKRASAPVWRCLPSCGMPAEAAWHGPAKALLSLLVVNARVRPYTYDAKLSGPTPAIRLRYSPLLADGSEQGELCRCASYVKLRLSVVLPT